MKKLFPLAIILLATSFLSAQTTPSWLRSCAISPDGSTIAFTYMGDLYRVPATGGMAYPLTLSEAHDFMPVWSSDGKTIAFASDRYGNFDIFTIPANGGEAKRLSYHSAAEYPYSFTADNQSVIFGAARMDAAANRQYPAAYMSELYQVGINGGRVTQLLTTPAEDVKLSSDGSLMVYHDKKGQENAWRKHQVSSVARDLWSYNPKTAEHKQLTTNKADERNPVLAADNNTLYYLSEASGNFNVYKTSLSNTAAAAPLTSFAMNPVRFLTASKTGLLCFSQNGDIYTMTDGGKPARLAVTISANDRFTAEKNVPVNGGIGGMAVSPNGKEVAFVFRGEVFVTAVEGTATKRITNTAEREAGVSFSPDGKKLLYASERNGKWQIFETAISRKEEPYFYASTVLNETLLVGNDRENYLPRYSPDGREMAYIENRDHLRVLNLATRQSRLILDDKTLFSWGDNDQNFEWSPDGKWLVFGFAEEGQSNGEIGLVSADGNGKPVNITENGFGEDRPKWMMDGNMILFVSDRDGLRSKANSGSSQEDAYAIFLNQKTWDKFRLGKEEAALQKEIDDKNAKSDTGKSKLKKDSTLSIEWDGLRDRKAKLTIHSSQLGDVLVSRDGENLYYLARFEKGLNLWTTNLRTRDTKMLVSVDAASGQLAWDKEQKSLFLQSDGGISKIDPASGKRDRISLSSEMILNTVQERAFMFEHVWRRTKTTFYTAGYHGAPWDKLKTNYAAFLPHIGNNYEFSELLSEMLGELNISHSGASYSGVNPNGDVTASLGAFYDAGFKGNGVKLEELIKDGPLDKAGLGLKPGMIIESIDGETITPSRDLAQYLNRKTGKNTLVSILDPADNSRRELVVRPISLGEEGSLLYKRWVRRNEAEVDRLSGGELGYVHIPGMNDGAFRVVYEEVMGRFGSKKAIVVDTRNNGGGDLVSDLTTFLSGKAFTVNATDKRVMSYEPTFRWNKPSISLANEANYSDGHCYAYAYQALDIGKLVGMPIPGTCTYAAWETLQDPSIRWGVPPVGVKMMNGQYLENHQTEPDVKVMNAYNKVDKGIDQQLEAAVAELLKALKK